MQSLGYLIGAHKSTPPGFQFLTLVLGYPLRLIRGLGTKSVEGNMPEVEQLPRHGVSPGVGRRLSSPGYLAKLRLLQAVSRLPSPAPSLHNSENKEAGSCER